MNTRKRNRLSGFDYSKGYAYFVTICIHDNLHLLSEIINEQSVLSESGKMIESWWLELSNKYDDVILDEYIIMPNHIHGIIIINDSVVDGLRVVPNEITSVGDDLCVVPGKTDRHIGPTLPEIIQWFKTMTTNEYIHGVKEGTFQRFNKHLWQRSYYDRIIRNEKEMNNIQAYIHYNPLKWDWEKHHPENLS
jgi:putative transposase